LLVLQVFAHLRVHVHLVVININELAIVIFVFCVFRMAFCQLSIVLVSLFEFTLLLKVDHFGVIDTNRASERLRPHNFVDEVHSLGG